MDADREVSRLAARQHGLASIWQLRDCGLSRSAVQRRVERGRLVKVRSRIYRVGGAPVVPEQGVMAACLAVEGAVASHRSAAALWRLFGFVEREPEVTAPTRARLTGARVHVGDVPQRQRRSHRGVPLTSPARTLVDLSGTQTDVVLGRALDEARRAALVSFADVLRCLQGRTCPQVRRLLDARLHDRSGSDREAHILWALEHAGLPLPEAQHEVVIEGQVVVLDYAYPAERVAVEFDGFEVHGAMRTAFDRDARRGNRLARSGWLVVRVTSTFTDEEIVREVGDALGARRMAGS